MTWSLFFVWGVVTLESGAAISYAVQGQWKLAGVWFGVSMANVCMALLDGAK